MKKIFIAGHNGMVGSAILRKLQNNREINILSVSRSKVDLTNQRDVLDLLLTIRPDEVILAAAKVGGIKANDSEPANFIYENLQIQNNVIHSSHIAGVQKLLFLGSSCIYPKMATQPITESALLTGQLEQTNEPYALAKIAGMKMCESYSKQFGRDYRSVMPTNLYGPGDNFNVETGHVIPALMRRFHEAKLSRQQSVSVWGSGKARREFLYVDDMAEAALTVHNLSPSKYASLTKAAPSHINIGNGEDISIINLAEKIRKVTKFDGENEFDKNKLEGTPRKLLDVGLIKKTGWNAKVSLDDGLRLTYQYFLSNMKADKS